MQARIFVGKMPINDKAMLEAFREGDKETFECIYNEIINPLLAFVVNLVNSREDAEDIVAETFYKIYLTRATINSIPHIKRRAYCTARNFAIDSLRLKARQHGFQFTFAYQHDEIEKHWESEQLKSLLFQNILLEMDKLSTRRKKILQLYFFEEKTTPEIARIMNLPNQTVLNNKNKALDILRKSGLVGKWLLEGLPG